MWYEEKSSTQMFFVELSNFKFVHDDRDIVIKLIKKWIRNAPNWEQKQARANSESLIVWQDMLS